MNHLLCSSSPGCCAETTRFCCVTATRDELTTPTSGSFQVGNVEAGESLSETLLRELAEELGITVDPPTAPAWMTSQPTGCSSASFSSTTGKENLTMYRLTSMTTSDGSASTTCRTSTSPTPRTSSY